MSERPGGPSNQLLRIEEELVDKAVYGATIREVEQVTLISARVASHRLAATNYRFSSFCLSSAIGSQW